MIWNHDSFWGEWLPTKEDPEKENSMRTWVGQGQGHAVGGPSRDAVLLE